MRRAPTDEAPAQQTARTTQSTDADKPSTDELVDLLRQERADFRNYRKRVHDDRDVEIERLRAGLVGVLLPIIDELDRALTDVPEHLANEPWVRGVVMSRTNLAHVQQELGLEQVGARGEPFDPSRHDAVIYEPDPEAAEATIAEVVRPGYETRGRLLRPAQVVVRGPLLRGEPGAAEPSDAGGQRRPDREPTGG